MPRVKGKKSLVTLFQQLTHDQEFHIIRQEPDSRVGGDVISKAKIEEMNESGNCILQDEDILASIPPT